MLRPNPGGSRDFPVSPAMVLSDDCEDTKAKKWGDDYYFVVAPLRELAQFDTGHGELGNIRAQSVRALFHLPVGGPLDREWVVDLRLTQPFTYAELVGSALWTSVGPPLKSALKFSLQRFFTGSQPKSPS